MGRLFFEAVAGGGGCEWVPGKMVSRVVLFSETCYLLPIWVVGICFHTDTVFVLRVYFC